MLAPGERAVQGGWGGWWLCCRFSYCGLPPAKSHCTDPQDTLFSPLGRHRCLGWGHTGGLSLFWSRREPGTQLEYRVSVVMIWLPGVPQELICLSPCGEGTFLKDSQKLLGGVAVPWDGQCQVSSEDTAQCSQLQSRDSSSLFCLPLLSPLAKDLTTSCVYISLFCLPWAQVGSWWLLLLPLAERLLIPRPELVIPRPGFCGHAHW